jgi:cytochrome P450
VALGHHVNAGDVVFMALVVLGRSVVLWEDPLMFDLDRFDPEAVE